MWTIARPSIFFLLFTHIMYDYLLYFKHCAGKATECAGMCNIKV